MVNEERIKTVDHVFLLHSILKRLAGLNKTI